MDTKEIIIPLRTFGQATVYGDEDYGNQIYSCQDGDVSCATSANNGETTTGTPNTGFMGMSQESAIFAVGGGLLLLVAVIFIVSFAIVRSRKVKNTTKEQ